MTIFFYINLFMAQMQLLNSASRLFKTFTKSPLEGSLLPGFTQQPWERGPEQAFFWVRTLTSLKLPVSVVVIANVISPASCHTKFCCVYICGECRSDRPQGAWLREQTCLSEDQAGPQSVAEHPSRPPTTRPKSTHSVVLFAYDEKKRAAEEWGGRLNGVHAERV